MNSLTVGGIVVITLLAILVIYHCKCCNKYYNTVPSPVLLPAPMPPPPSPMSPLPSSPPAPVPPPPRFILSPIGTTNPSGVGQFIINGGNRLEIDPSTGNPTTGCMTSSVSGAISFTPCDPSNTFQELTFDYDPTTRVIIIDDINGRRLTFSTNPTAPFAFMAPAPGLVQSFGADPVP